MSDEHDFEGDDKVPKGFVIAISCALVICFLVVIGVVIAVVITVYKVLDKHRPDPIHTNTTKLSLNGLGHPYVPSTWMHWLPQQLVARNNDKNNNSNGEIKFHEKHNHEKDNPHIFDLHYKEDTFDQL